MFYKDPVDPIIRQGDIINGLISPEIIAHNFLDKRFTTNSDPSFSIDVRFNFAAVITPCCTIQKANYLSLCPLIPLLKDFEQNPFLSEDPTRVNLKVPPEKCVPPISWEKVLTPEERQRRIEKGSTYIYLQYFVFKKYKDILTDDVMIDFTNTFNIRRKDLGNKNIKMLPVRVLQLSDETRETLRQKLVAFFIRKPEEE